MDFDIHGAIGIRVIGAAGADSAALVRQLGPPQSLQGREPDITICYQDYFDSQHLVYLGLNEMAFDQEGFYILGRRDGKIKAQIPFASIGRPCDVLCRRGIGDVPLLPEIIMFTLLGRGYLPLHASAFRYGEKGILVAGWTKGGKTETLLSFANHGAEYVGDECVVIDREGKSMFGLPYPITLWDWQFGQIPRLLPPVSKSMRMRFRAIQGLDALYRTVEGSRWAHTFAFALLAKALPTLRRQRKVVHAPHTLFRRRICQRPVPIDRVFLSFSRHAQEICVEPCTPHVFARRMRYSNDVEQTNFMDYYRAFRFAFPHQENDLLENASARQEDLLRRAIVGKDVYTVYHPYPVAFAELFAHMQPYCE